MGMSTPVSHVGRVIDGRYSVVDFLGGGAFGQVFEVFDDHLQRCGALKVFQPISSNTWVEAQVLNTLRGDFIVEVRNAALDAGIPYVETELAQHGTLADRIVPDVGTPVRDAVRWVTQACQGVARIHDHKMVHRDIKPENIFLNGRCHALIGDLGLAQLWDPTGRCEAAGTLTTMAPEVAKAWIDPTAPPRPYTGRSDVYSLGATLYWMLAGVPLRDANASTGTVCTAIVTDASPDVWEAAPHLNRGLRDVVNTAIAYDETDRHNSPSDLASALDGLAPSRGAKPSRCWDRRVTHPTHVMCFDGVKGASHLEVCAVPTAGANQIEIQVWQAGRGRRVGIPWPICNRSKLPMRLRAVFRKHR